VKAIVGAKATKKIYIDEKIPKTVKLYSSHDDVVFFPPDFTKPITLHEDKPTELQYGLYPKKEENYQFVLNCVDVSIQQSIRSWLIKVIPEKPLIKKFIRLDCRANRNNNVKFEYENEVNSWMILNFESSQPNILKVKLFKSLIFKSFTDS